MTSAPPAPVPQTQSKIPGLESPTSNSHEVFSFIESKVKEDNVPLWNNKPLTKYQSWPSPEISWNLAQETPVSPPAFERESYSHPVEYVDNNMDTNRFSNPFGGDHVDVDHRLMKPPMLREFQGQVGTIPLPKHDVDDRLSLKNSIANRNLISLTESPSVNDSWKSDADFRTIPMPPTPPSIAGENRVSKTPQDIIESVDMEMSDDEDKHDDKKGEAKHRKTSVREDERPSEPKQLQPPPNPWDMLNIPLDGDENAPKPSLGDFMANMMPRGPDFGQFPMPPNPRGMKPFGDMHFPPPMNLMRMPPGEPMFRPRMDFPRLPNLANGFNGPPFNFMPDGVMFPNANLNQVPRKDFPPFPPFNDRKFQGKRNVNMEPHIRPKFEEGADFAVKPPKVRSNLKEISLSDVLERTMNSVDESRKQTEEVTEANDVKEREEINEEKETNKLDLFSEEVPNEGVADDGDDLYNNIEETTEPTDKSTIDDQRTDDEKPMISRQLPSDVRFVQNSSFVVYESEEDIRNSAILEDESKPKAPFQATVPKLPKPIMAPPNFMEDFADERNPWPMLPVIDLSIENHPPPEFNHIEEHEPNLERLNPLAFLKANGTQDFRMRFGRGMNNDFRPPNFMNNSPRDRRFTGQMSSPRMMDLRPRFPNTPRQEFRSHQDFRPRMNVTPNQEFIPHANSTPGPEFRPNQDQMRRMQRPPFLRSPGATNFRGNFQNSPRMFKGARPFRRGW